MFEERKFIGMWGSKADAAPEDTNVVNRVAGNAPADCARENMMDYKTHLNGVGAIVTNLQAVETVLRRFLVSKFGQCSKFPEPGADIACRSYLTAYVSLGSLIDDYHKVLTDEEQGFKIDASIVELRDALAHGRLVVRGNDPPYELWKFGKSSGSKTAVDFFAILTEEWLKEKWRLVESQQQKVINCSNNRGYAAF